MAEPATIASVQVGSVEAGGTTLFVRRFGDQDGRPLLYWHGGGGASEELPELAPALADAGWMVYAPDAPGYGSSPPLEPSGYRPSLVAGLAAALIDALEVGPVVWVGSSWGAAVGVRTAVYAPDRVRALALLDGGYLEARDDPDFDPASTLESRTAELRALAEAGESWDAPPEVVAAVIHGEDGEPPTSLLPALGANAVPVLLLHATDPAEYEALRARALERFKAAVPQAQVVGLPGAGHTVLRDAGAEVRRLLLDWLARIS